MSDLLRNLNPQQLEAVTLPPCHALILAGAGSGKTRVLITRIAWLISTGQASPRDVLAVTFTNKAAKEMLARLSARLPINTRGMWVGTFHGLCNRLLRAHARDAGLPEAFQILDASDQLAAVKRLLKRLNVDDEKHPPREVAQFINAHKEAGERPDAVEAWDDFTRQRAGFWQEYENQCQREGVVDFAELLLRSYELLSRNEPLRAHYQERFRHILVDEFQDTNVLQYRWLKQMAGGGAALFCVGDDDQSIYAFRGAQVGNMRDFEREFRVGKVIRLEQNYRSHGNILDAANAIIKNNAARLGKNLWTDAGAGEPLRVFEAQTDLEEARWIVDEIRSAARAGQEASRVALLYRSNAQSRVLEHALFSAGLPYRVYGGLRFFERQEIKHALAYLRLLANADDDTAFQRVVNFPARGIGARSIEALQEAARAGGVSLAAAASALSGKTAIAVGAFTGLLARLAAACAGLPLPEVVEQVVEHSGLRAHYRTEREGADRLANLDELVNAAANFVSENEDGSLVAFLGYASLEAGEHQAGEGEGAIQLMTAHSAKGLEFDVVFVSGLEEGLFPHENALDEDKGLEEERRLMYVAVTRARRRLYLSFAQTRMLHGHTRYSVKSRFLDEIPQQLLRWMSPRGAGRARLPAPARFAPAPRLFNPKPGSEDGGQGTEGRNNPEPETRKAKLAGLSGFRVGQSVLHARFGPGVIVGAEGGGSDARVQVSFEGAGLKWLVLAMANLRAA